MNYNNNVTNFILIRYSYGIEKREKRKKSVVFNALG